MATICLSYKNLKRIDWKAVNHHHVYIAKIAVSIISTCSSSCENSTLKDGDNDPKILKCSLLSLSVNDLIWEGDLESLKRFVETELQMNGRWSTARGENFKFSNPEFSLKWDGTTDKKITVMQDNDENQLYTTLIEKKKPSIWPWRVTIQRLTKQQQPNRTEKTRV
jgi:hypothetical protein